MGKVVCKILFMTGKFLGETKPDEHFQGNR